IFLYSNTSIIYTFLNLCMCLVYYYILFSTPLQKIKTHEKETNSKLIIITDKTNIKSYIPFQNLNGIYVINNDDDETFIEWISTTYEQNCPQLDIIVHTKGGNVESADIIMNLLHNYPNKINFYIPYYAFSAGTSIVLSGIHNKNIYMNEYSFLGPTDPQTEY